MIDFEQDQAEAITQTNDVKALSDQVVQLRSLEDNLAAKEKEISCSLKFIMQNSSFLLYHLRQNKILCF